MSFFEYAFKNLEAVLDHPLLIKVQAVFCVCLKALGLVELESPLELREKKNLHEIIMRNGVRYS